MFAADAWPMIGRERELGLIARELATSPTAGVAVTGAMGVGKSRLAREALAAVKPDSVIWVAGSSAARVIPLGAFVRWLPPREPDPARATNLVIAELVGRGGRRPVIVVDDAQLLDDTSAFMLEQLIDRRLATVVLTATTTVGVSDAVAALWRSARLRRIDVSPLDRDGTAAFLETALNGPVEPVSRQQLWALTRGNVCYLRHILEEGVQSRRIRAVDGTWTLSGEIVIPAAVRELVEQQMGALPPAVAEAVDLLSVAGPLRLATVQDMVGAGALEDAEKRALIVVDGTAGEATAQLAHPLYGRVRQLKAGHIRLRRLRGAVVARIEATDDPIQTLRRGVLLLESDIAAGVEDLLHAAEAAAWRGNGALALRLANAAHAGGAGWRASVARAEALMLTGALDEAMAVLDGIAIGTAHAPAVSRARLALLQGSTADIGLSDVATAAVSATVRAITSGETGRVDAVPSLAGNEIHGSATSFTRFLLAEAQCSAWQLAGELNKAAAVLDDLRDDEHPADVARWMSMMTGSVLLSSGRVDTAVRLLHDAVAAQREAFLGGWLWRYRIDLAIATAIRGDVDGAKRCMTRLDAAPHPAVAYFEPMTMLVAAWISAAHGSVSQAIAEARTAAVSAATLGLPAREVLCLQTATRFGDESTVGRLDELVHVVAGPRAGVAQAHARSLAAGDGDALMAVSQQYSDMGDALSALDAAAQAATVFRRLGRNGSALNATCRVRALKELCGRVRTPATAAAAAPPVFTGREREVIMLVGNGLTNREIAERLQLSIRTVEGHVYRAAGRVGARDRNELARAIG